MYNALVKKGVTFPESTASSQPAEPQRVSPQKSSPSKQSPEKKRTSDLAPKYQKIIKEMNLMKGNINFTNEIIDTIKTRAELQSNDTLIDLLKQMKEQEPKLINLIQSTEDDEIMAVCLLVNEDLQKTFNRFKAIKNGG